MINEKKYLTRISWKTNDNKLIYGALVPNLSQFLTFKNNNIYFLTKENNVIWCDLEMLERIITRYLQHDTIKLPKALADARFASTLF